jgi:broad specificity phosphatase PhoE
MAILLIRHGETDGNARRFLQHPETPLSARGEAQALRVAARLAAERQIGAILSSDYARAHGTALRIRDASGASLELEPGLRERNFGSLRGRFYDELGFDPFAPGYAPPDGETWEALHARADATWERAVARAAAIVGDLVLVTHGLVCHSIVSRRLHLAGAAAPPGFGNTAVTIAEACDPFAVSLLGCTAHLDAETAHDTRSVSGL